ncbi:MAG: glycoside hydrolase family 44 protein [Ignavibacteriaceae bacterium]
MKSFYIVLFFIAAFIQSIFSQEVNFTIIVSDSLKNISPYIFGTNQLLNGDENWASMRQGGNRMTGYNWENNASNAGSDYNQQSDNYLTWVNGIPSDSENIPGIVTSKFQNQALHFGAYSLVTLQMAGYAAKDKNGPVSEAEKAPSPRWAAVEFEKGSPFSLSPNVSDTNIYIDEYVNFLVNKFGTANSITGVKGYSLDNEPSLWISTHPRLHPLKPTCREIMQRSIGLSKAVKEVDSTAEIFGPALYGFNAYLTFQDADDWNTVKAGKNYSWFIDYYLDKMKEAEKANGRRLLDVLDVHWYPEAIGDNRITETNANTLNDKSARIQAPRTLWDKNYTENSWIGQWGKAHLPLIPGLMNSINKYYTGTQLGFTEFTYGGENDITGAIAVDDVLGIFAKYGVYFATFWQIDSPSDYISAAYKIYRNYDGNNSTIGNFYIPSWSSDSVNCSVYSSTNSEKDTIHIVAINKSFNQTITGNFSISSPKKILSGKIWMLDNASADIINIDSLDNIKGNIFSYNLPPQSVFHFVLNMGYVLSVNENKNVPDNFYLKAYPNPFNPVCKIEYNAPGNSISEINIISITGKLIRSYIKLNHHGILYWDGTNENNQKVATGVYLAVLRNGYQISTQKLIYLK